MHLKALEQRAECHASLQDLDSAIADWELLGRSAAVEAVTKKMAAKRLVEARATKNQIPRQTPLVQTPARRHLRPRAAPGAATVELGVDKRLQFETKSGNHVFAVAEGVW